MQKIFSTTYISCFILVLLLVTFGCNRFHEDQEVPAYIQIDTIGISPASAATFGLTPSSGIAEAWITVDGLLLGGFQLPACIPVLESGEHKVLIQSGILINNLSTRNGIYPFYSGLELTVNFEENKISNVTYKPDGTLQTLVALRSSNKYVLSEDFEGPRVAFDTVKNYRSVPMVPTPCEKVPLVPTPYLYYGTRVGYIHLQEGDSCCIASKDIFEDETALPFNQPIFVEIDYLTNNTFEVGVISHVNNKTIFYSVAGAGKQKKQEWGKVYIDISSRVSEQLNVGSSGFNLFIRASLDEGNTEAHIYLDNIRLVHAKTN